MPVLYTRTHTHTPSNHLWRANRWGQKWILPKEAADHEEEEEEEERGQRNQTHMLAMSHLFDMER